MRPPPSEPGEIVAVALFMWMAYEAKGGWGDLVGVYDSAAEAGNAAEARLLAGEYEHNVQAVGLSYSPAVLFEWHVEFTRGERPCWGGGEPQPGFEHLGQSATGYAVWVRR